MSDNEVLFESETVQQLAAESGLDFADIEGSGEDGAITITDLENALDGSKPDEELIEATDAARELAEENGVSLDDIEGTGKDGKVGKPDVQKHIDEIAGYSEDDEEEGEDEVLEPESVDNEGMVLLNFKENSKNYRKGDVYDGSHAEDRREQGLIA